MLPIRRPGALTAVALLLALSSACSDSLTPNVASMTDRSAALRRDKSDAAGVMYALSYEGQVMQGVQRIISIDPVTGALAVAATVPGVHWITGPSAFDPGTGRYFFYGSASINASTRYSVNVRTGEVHTFGDALAGPEVNENSWQFDPSSGLLYALSYEGTMNQGVQRIISIDPSSGAVAVAATIPGVHWISGEAAFDPATGRYFFTGSGVLANEWTRYAVNLRTGEIRTFGVQLSWPPANETGWEFDATSGLLYALSYDGPMNQGVQRIISIDPANGAVAVAATIAGVHWISGETAIDPVTGRFFFTGSNAGFTEFTRYAVDFRTGEIQTFGTQLNWPPANELGWQFDASGGCSQNKGQHLGHDKCKKQKKGDG